MMTVLAAAAGVVATAEYRIHLNLAVEYVYYRQSEEI